MKYISQRNSIKGDVSEYPADIKALKEGFSKRIYKQSGFQQAPKDHVHPHMQASLGALI